MKHKVIATAVLVLFGAIIFSSCKKKDDSDPDYSISSEINAVREDLDDAMKVSEGALRDENQFDASQFKVDQTFGGGCAIRTIDIPNKIITLDFGSIGCLGNDGRTRKGKLIINYTDRYTTDGAVITIKTNNYYVNGKKVQGRRTVTNTGTNLAGNITYTVVDRDTSGTGYAKITQLDGSITTWKASTSREWTSGSSTPLSILDDEHLITGVADGVSSRGVAYDLTATSIKVKAACWTTLVFVPVSGTLGLVTSDGSRSIDYGDGTCDRNAQYTHTNGKTYNIVLY